MHSRLRSRLARASALITLLAAADCKKDAAPPVPASAGSRAATPSPKAAAVQEPPQDPDFPPLPSREALPTTAGSIAIGTLDDDILQGDKLLSASPDNPALQLRLVPLFLMHAKTEGLLNEYDRALALAESAVKLDPKNPQAWVALSNVHATLHRFEEAQADLKRAQALGAHGSAIDSARAGLFQSLGRYAEARQILEKQVADWARIDSLGALATLDADEGQIETAERHFQEAQKAFSEVTPFPLVWLWFQQGLMWQKEGRLARARELFAAAHERIPADVAVTSHLAAMFAATGDRERAIALLRQVVLTADDPEYMGQLSQLLREEGNIKDADELRSQAIARYETLIKRQPAAFAEHAARFWIGPGADPKKAVPLAKLNLERRQTPDAYALAIEVRLAAKEPAAETCQLAERAITPPAFATPHLRVQASRAFIACGKKDRADAVLAAIAPAAPAPAAPAPAAPAPAAPAPAPAPAAPAPAAPARAK